MLHGRLVERAEAEAAELAAEAVAERAEAAARAVDLIAKAELEAEELINAASKEAMAKRDGVLGEKAELAAEQDTLALQREALEAERSALAAERDQLAERIEKIDEREARIGRKQDILNEAQEAFITERTVLQRRWAEVEQKGIDALERAHEQAEAILREAREQANQATAAPSDSDADPIDGGETAQDVLARLDSALEAAREVAASRTSAEEEEAAVDNDTITSGVWDQVPEETATGTPPPPADFDVPIDPLSEHDSGTQ